MERLTNLEGKISPCTCGRQPKLLYRFGKQVYALECCVCSVRTSFHPTAQQAVAEWETSHQKETV